MVPRRKEEEECHQCMKFLKCALDEVSSRPKILLQAMGVDTTSQFWELDENGRGVRITIPPSRSPLLINNKQQQQQGFGGGTRAAASEPTATYQPPLSKERVVNLVSKLTRRLSPTPALPSPVATSSLATDDDSSAGNKCSISLSILCRECGNTGPEAGARAYVRGPDPLSIVLCSNRLSSLSEITQVLIHEFIHVYDVHARHWDLRNCHVLAKSEVRAAREAECEDSLNRFTLAYCARNKACVATRNLFPGSVGNTCVGRVFDEAFADLAPFGPPDNTDTVGGSNKSTTAKNGPISSK